MASGGALSPVRPSGARWVRARWPGARSSLDAGGAGRGRVGPAPAPFSCGPGGCLGFGQAAGRQREPPPLTLGAQLTGGAGPAVGYGELHDDRVFAALAHGFDDAEALPCGQLTARRRQRRVAGAYPSRARAGPEASASSGATRAMLWAGREFRDSELRAEGAGIDDLLGFGQVAARPSSMTTVICLSGTRHSVVSPWLIRFGKRWLAQSGEARAASGLPSAAARAVPASARRGIIAGLGHVQLVSQPERIPLDAPPGISVIRGSDPGFTVRETVAFRLLLRRLTTSLPPGPMMRV